MASRKELFPFNGKSNGKSSYPLPGRGNHFGLIEIINIDKIIKKELVPEYLKPENEYILFYHGTTSENAKAIVNSGINVKKGDPRTDFGQGFYVSKDFQYARDFVKHSNEYTVLVFKLTLTFWDAQGSSGYVFKNDSDEFWEEFVAYNRRCNRGGKFAKKSKQLSQLELESKAFIQGHVCARNLERKSGTSKQTLPKDPAIQVCIKTNELAKTFFSYLYAAFSYNNSLYK
ncbi:unnamed protein product [Lymnaea stagnalis]|uniref:DUF3990 domain-containing protein n=1 Tax=Lymnaea stagnalis TaxID=6523 RepID=A0AAV2HRW0_LYMST